MILTKDDKEFMLKAMPVFGIEKVKIAYSPSQARWPDIWVSLNRVPVITVTDEWRRQRPAERRKRLVHELLHCIGKQHDEKIGYSTIPVRDKFSKMVYRKLIRKNPIPRGKPLTWEDMGNLKKRMTVIAAEDIGFVRGHVPKGMKGKIDYVSQYGAFRGVAVTFENGVRTGTFSPDYLIKANPIDPITPTIVTGVGLGVGFRVAEAAWDKVFRRKK